MQRPVSWLVQELDSILVQQKAVSCVTEKAKWWEGRRTLDSRVEVSRLKRQCWELFFFHCVSCCSNYRSKNLSVVDTEQHLLTVMEEMLGCWKSFLLPSSPDPQLSRQTQHLSRGLSSRGLTCSEEMLKVWTRSYRLDNIIPWFEVTDGDLVTFVPGCSVCISCALPGRRAEIQSRGFSTLGRGVWPAPLFSCVWTVQVRAAPRSCGSHPGQGCSWSNTSRCGQIRGSGERWGVNSSCSVLFAVSPEVAVGERLHFEVSLRQSDAFPPLTDGTERSEGGRISHL